MDDELKVTEVTAHELKAWLGELFKQYALDIGQRIAQDELSNAQIRAYYQLVELYPNWKIIDVKNAIKMALNFDDKKLEKLTVKNLFTWFRLARDKFAASHIREREALNIDKINRFNGDLEMSAKLGAALSWKLRFFRDRGKEFRRVNWGKYPLRQISEALENGDVPAELT